VNTNTIDLSRVEFHSFHWDNFSPEILVAHKKVMQHFGLNVTYTQKNIPHGQWLDEVMQSAKSEVIAIIEPDLIPLNRQIVDDAISYVLQHDSFLGCAQASNHIYPASHIFASPAFFFMTKSCYQRLGCPSFLETKTGDVAENISYLAEQLGIRYRTLYPTYFERVPREGIWPLGSYGYYGIGTVFHDSVYHLFQSRMAENIELFVKRCDEVLQHTFSTQGFISCTGFEKLDNVVPFRQKRKRWYQKLLGKFK
jgi:hypothetical protein